MKAMMMCCLVPAGVGSFAPGEVAVGGRALEAVILVGEEGATLGLLAPRLAFAFRDVAGVEGALDGLARRLNLDEGSHLHACWLVNRRAAVEECGAVLSSCFGFVVGVVTMVSMSLAWTVSCSCMLARSCSEQFSRGNSNLAVRVRKRLAMKICVCWTASCVCWRASCEASRASDKGVTRC